MGGDSFLFTDLNNFHFHFLNQGHPHMVTVTEMYNTYLRVIIILLFYLCSLYIFFLLSFIINY